MRNPVRKFVGMALIGVLGALFALPMISAGAQEGGAQPAPPGPCTFTAAGVAPGTVTGTVTAPAGANEVTVTFTPNVGQPGVVQQQTFPVPPLFHEFSFVVQGSGLVTANFAYGDGNVYAAGCEGPNGEAAIAILLAENVALPQQAAALAFTGSSDTPTYVLIGVAALVFGAVLVVAARRRSQVS